MNKIRNSSKVFPSLGLLMCFIVPLCGLNHNRQDSSDAPQVFFGFINDNYTGSVECGKKGLYLGPDDFITFSTFCRIQSGDWCSVATYNIFTSRKFKVRYDLLSLMVSRLFNPGPFMLQPGLGLLWKGRFQGAELQNWYHGVRGLPEVNLPYSAGGLGVVVSTQGSWPIETRSPRSGILTPALELRLVTNHLPWRITPMLGYQTDFRDHRLELELLGGSRIYLNQVEDYSRLIRPGLFMGINLKTRLHQSVYFDLGMTLFPARNLANDPLYADQPHHVIPQITMVLSWNSSRSRLYNYLEY